MIRKFSISSNRYFSERDSIRNARKSISDMEAEIAGVEKQLTMFKSNMDPNSNDDRLKELSLRHRIDQLNHRIQGKQIDIDYWNQCLRLK